MGIERKDFTLYCLVYPADSFDGKTNWTNLAECDARKCPYRHGLACSDYVRMCRAWARARTNPTIPANPYTFYAGDIVVCVSSSLVYPEIVHAQLYRVRVATQYNPPSEGTFFVEGFVFPVSARCFRKASAKEAKRFRKQERKEGNRIAVARRHQATARGGGYVTTYNPGIAPSLYPEKRPVHSACDRGKAIGGRT